ncbi:hypothetical protein FS837_010310 [Tulasnella sp. UAMH 9824]|nr:hypothetical protein FS837_010310 [Tulasnella sp. UAMH 9824]
METALPSQLDLSFTFPDAPEELGGVLEIPDRPEITGGYADVYHGFWTNPQGERVDAAIKILRVLNPRSRHSDQDSLVKKAETPQPRLVSPWCHHGDLEYYLRSNPSLSRCEKLLLVYQAGCGLHHLHSCNPPICHADIKPRNVLVNDLGEAALSDFGLSRAMLDLDVTSGFTTSETVKGTFAYMAGELSSGQKASFILRRIMEDEPPKPEDHPVLPAQDSLWELMRRCWDQRPAARPTIFEVLIELREDIGLKQPPPQSCSDLATPIDAGALGLAGTLESPDLALPPRPRRRSYDLKSTEHSGLGLALQSHPPVSSTELFQEGGGRPKRDRRSSEIAAATDPTRVLEDPEKEGLIRPKHFNRRSSDKGGLNHGKAKWPEDFVGRLNSKAEASVAPYRPATPDLDEDLFLAITSKEKSLFPADRAPAARDNETTPKGKAPANGTNAPIAIGTAASCHVTPSEEKDDPNSLSPSSHNLPYRRPTHRAASVSVQVLLPRTDRRVSKRRIFIDRRPSAERAGLLKSEHMRESSSGSGESQTGVEPPQPIRRPLRRASPHDHSQSRQAVYIPKRSSPREDLSSSFALPPAVASGPAVSHIRVPFPRTASGEHQIPAHQEAMGSNMRRTIVVREEGKAPIHYQLGNCIGRGQFGTVYRALNINTGRTVAVKRIRLEGLSESEITQLMKEVNLLKQLDHPSIVQYEGTARDDESLDIVLEYVENGSLGQTLKAFGKFGEKLVAAYVTKILEGLHYLHKQKVVHCDLKAANILSTKNGNIKLSDFGVSLTLNAMGNVKETANNAVGTPNWMGPEVIKLKGASTASDIWSLGCTVVELLTGKPPYSEIGNTLAVMFRIVEDDKAPIPDDCSETLRDFLTQCFKTDPAERPTAESLFEHPWLKRTISTDLATSIWDLAEVSRTLGTSPASRPMLRRPDFVVKAHTFVKTMFSKPVTCKVCQQYVKKNAVFCEECCLICHVTCAKDASSHCDALLYSQYMQGGLTNGSRGSASSRALPSPTPPSPRPHDVPLLGSPSVNNAKFFVPPWKRLSKASTPDRNAVMAGPDERGSQRRSGNFLFRRSEDRSRSRRDSIAGGSQNYASTISAAIRESQRSTKMPGELAQRRISTITFETEPELPAPQSAPLHASMQLVKDPTRRTRPSRKDSRTDSKDCVIQ